MNNNKEYIFTKHVQMGFHLPLGGSGVKEILLLMLLVPCRSDSHSSDSGG